MLTKITEQQLAEKGVVSAPDKLEGDPKDNKAIFDRLITQLVAGVVNQIIEAHNALDENVNGRINAVLDELRNHVDVDPGNIAAQNVGLLRELADKYGLTDKLAPTVHDALGVLKTQNFTLETSNEPSAGFVNTTVGRTGRLAMYNNGHVRIDNILDADNYMGLAIKGERDGAVGVLQLVRNVDGKWTTTNVLHEDNVEALKVARVVHGSYTGTGEGRKTLTFPFTPKFVYIAPTVQSDKYSHVFAINGMTQACNAFDLTTSQSYYPELTWGENSLSLYAYLVPSGGGIAPSAEGAMNRSGTTYRYVVIG